MGRSRPAGGSKIAVNTASRNAAVSSRESGSASRSPRTTYFAPAGRDAPVEFHRKATMVQKAPLLRQALDNMPTMAMILNTNRQIVAANESLLRVLNSVPAHVAEKRPGEVLGCIRAKDGPDGCGTARHCVTCGAVDAILESQRRETKVVRECCILVDTAGVIAPMELRVTASPLSVDGECFTMVAVEDISQSKRFALLQRTFFHDVLNTAGCIQGYAKYLIGDGRSDPSVFEELAHLSDQLIEDIQAQRDLVNAESGDLQAQPVPLRIPSILEELRLQYAKHPVAKGREIALKDVWDGLVIADRRFLLRVLSNMVKNALEATCPGRAVTLSCADLGEEVRFAVHNVEVIPEQVQLQVFHRSFSTKGQPGRGIGTYSMKLFGERYMDGKVEFTSRSPEGTTFTLTLPKVPSTL